MCHEVFGLQPQFVIADLPFDILERRLHLLASFSNIFINFAHNDGSFLLIDVVLGLTVLWFR